MTTLSTDQANALDYIVSWYRRSKGRMIHCNGGGRQGFTSCPKEPHTHGAGQAPVMALGGWAGSGKTTLMSAVERALGVQSVFGTPTHKAAAVLRKKLPGPQAGRVRTYHSLIYHVTPDYFCEISGKRVQRIVDNCVCGQNDACQCPASFDPCRTGKTHACQIREELSTERRHYLGGHRDLVIIDESSMLSGEQVGDIRSFGVPILLVGDHGQLPPVKAEMNHWTRNPDVELTKIHRQNDGSGILDAAHDVRRHGHLRQSRYGKGDAVRYKLSNPIMEGVLDRWIPSPDRVIITGTNRLRAEINNSHHGEGPLREGDRVVALGSQQPYDTLRVQMEGDSFRSTRDLLQVHNGMTGTILKVIDTKGGPLLDMVVELDDHVLATPEEPVCLLVGAVARAQFGAERDLRIDSPHRPKGARLWDYAYALTAHKAQGSEFGQVIVMDESPPSYKQWLYTSVTRAKEAVVIADYRR